MEKKMALRRQRRRNRKYFCDDFTSIYTEKKNLLSNDGYIEQNVEVETVIQEEVITQCEPPVSISSFYIISILSHKLKISSFSYNSY